MNQTGLLIFFLLDSSLYEYFTFRVEQVNKIFLMKKRNKMRKTLDAPNEMNNHEIIEKLKEYSKVMFL